MDRVYPIPLRRRIEEVEVTEGEFNKMVDNVCYSESLCRILGVNYVNIRESDYDIIRDYVRREYRVRVREQTSN